MLPCSSTNPTSWSDLPQVACAQVKWLGHQVLPKAVMKGPLKIDWPLTFQKLEEHAKCDVIF